MKNIKKSLDDLKKVGKLRWGITTVACVLLLALLIFAIGKGRNNVDKTEKVSESVTAKPVMKVQDYVKLCDYSSMKFSLKPAKEDLEAEIANVIQNYTTYTETSGTVEDGDKVFIDYVGKVDGKALDCISGKDFLVVGSGDMPVEFEKEMIGLKTGKTKKFFITIPKDTYHNKDVDGKKAEYTVTVEYICGEANVPKYNKQFIQSISKYHTVKQYNHYLERKLMKKNEKNKENIVWNNVVEKSTVTDYPEDYTDLFQKAILQEYKDRAKKDQCSLREIYQQYGYEDEKDFEQSDLKIITQNNVKEALIADAIADKEGLSYPDGLYLEEVEKEYASVSDGSMSQQDFEKKNRKILQEKTMLAFVKTWLAKHVKYQK